MEMSKLDKNLEIKNAITRGDLEWHDITDGHFGVYGLYEPALKGNPQRFCRMDPQVAAGISEPVRALNGNTAGGRITFATDSDVLAIRHDVWQMVNEKFSLLSSSGFDCYIYENGAWRFSNSFIPTLATEGGRVAYESEYNFENGEMRELTLNFPIFSTTAALSIGLKKGCKIVPAHPYKNDKPVVFYGSSITQGACASRPGNTYEGFLSRMLDIDYLNLGFSGNAKGEKEMAEYIAELPMSVFVYDYDYNAPTVAHLEDTHYNFYKIIRDKNPDLPIICMSRPEPFDWSVSRRKIIKSTVERAVLNGDKNIVFLDGSTLFEGECKDSCTVDGCHPTDLGFYRMAASLKPLIEKYIK